ncbi:hypothetical protein K9U39_16620 [Rhodoblastus acidophilus]|uniref:Lysozyme inhibitor LprI N-terminal domain-containing protein n=1 Tax=Candidatus Rhodoblastus alkanivorans TaxID=2954117 RepID=A0ABS9Z2T6_9HYPH|nr:hypothetical protein [Candidatus Rhodoblastus alkanivorans]MCI4679928.1 hypothetical protein [Candidatus Rhodoblastus alkanivorans]MCI4681497.1 hypothetical protein [Candidatus Rhodoblastus alkanivorans]MDI4642545.1 hypothetical protein [Rhodoblastus acidophilus]
MRLVFFAPVVFLIFAGVPSRAQIQLPGAVGAPTPKGQVITPPRAVSPRPREEYSGHFTVAKPPELVGVLSKPLRLLGVRGALQIEKSGDRLVVTRFVAAGDKISHPNQPCEVSMGGEGPVRLKALGSPDGVHRLELDSSACPLQFDVLNGAVRARSPIGVCAFTQADCRIDAAGLWGPAGGSFSDAEIKSMEKERGAIERAMRAHFRTLLSKYKKDKPAAETVIKDQAAFSAERAQACRDYDREEATGFCALRLTEARDFRLQSQLAAEDAARKSERPRDERGRLAKPHILRTVAPPP